ncbi:hypothetical protein LTR33_009128 [Friedmanniomyces endolithicus]|nr:hypothetical protein LTR33_009128 [Friedmanniomyces endolithicus]
MESVSEPPAPPFLNERVEDRGDLEPVVDLVGDEEGPRRPQEESSEDESLEDEEVAGQSDSAVRRLRRAREVLRAEQEIERVEEQLDQIRRRRLAGHTPAQPVGESVARHRRPLFDDTPSVQGRRRAFTPERTANVAGASQAGPVRSSDGHTRPKLREPYPLPGKTLKEAREFIHSLELVVGQLARYLWDDFKKFVLDSVEDPVNRSLSVTLHYEAARQRDGQTAQAFASELTTLEEQMSAYTEEQRTRHLLAKLRPHLRTAVFTYHSVPARRDDLVSLVTRLESASKRELTMGSGASAGSTHTGGDSRRRYSDSRGTKRRRSPERSSKNDASGTQSSRQGNARSSGAGSGSSGEKKDVVCYSCDQPGHYPRAFKTCGSRLLTRVCRTTVVQAQPPTRQGSSHSTRQAVL